MTRQARAQQAGSTKGERRAQRSKGGQQRPQVALPGDDLLQTRQRTQRDRKPYAPKTDAQKRYANAIEIYDLIFCRGVMGTGKTYIAAAEAAQRYEAKQVDKIVITRPCLGAEEEYGFLPGDLNDKTAPWAKPVIDVLKERLGAGQVEYMLEAGTLEIAPLGMLRGATFNNAFVVFDEAQNATKGQMKLFLTRIGENVKVVVDGDPDEQLDIAASNSGFNDAWNRMQGHPQIGFMAFDIEDVVRSGLSRDILQRYRQPQGACVARTHTGPVLARGPTIQ